MYHFNYIAIHDLKPLGIQGYNDIVSLPMAQVAQILVVKILLALGRVEYI